MTITSVLPHRCILGEGPFWNPNTNSICWIDILAPCIHSWNESSDTHRIWQTPSMIGCAALDGNGDFIVALVDGFWKCNSQTRALSLLVQLEAEKTRNRFNDGKCDPSGRFWAGSLSLNEKDPTGSVYFMDAQQDIKKVIDDVTISNGLCWSLDKRFFYYIDTPTLAVARYDYEDSSGNISNKTIIINIPEEDGFPDGMTMDADGMLWIAHWGGWQITRWDPHNGNKIATIRMPASQITSLCFGGKNYEDIYVTSASRGLSEKELAEEPLAGHLFVIRNSGFKGMPFHTYKSNHND